MDNKRARLNGVAYFCFCPQRHQELPAVVKKTEISSKFGMVSEKTPIF